MRFLYNVNDHVITRGRCSSYIHMLDVATIPCVQVEVYEHRTGVVLGNYRNTMGKLI